MPYYDLDSFGPDTSIGYLCKRITQFSLAGFAPALEQEGITYSQWLVLVSLFFGRGNTCAELARDLGHDNGAMTRLVDSLAQSGWVERERIAADRRIVKIALTEEGIAITHRCQARVAQCWNGWLEEWDKAEVDRLIALLQKLRGTMEAQGACA